MRIATAIGIPNRQSPVTGDLFTPPDVSGLAIWLRADLGITIATGVSNWLDARGAGSAIAQVTGANQPAFSATGAPTSKPCVVFDGVNDSLFGAFALVQPEQVFLVAKYNAVFAASDDLMDGSAGNTMRVVRSTNTTVSIFAPTGLGSATFDTTNWHYLTFTFNGASSVGKQDGVQLFAGNAGANNAAGLRLGTFGDGASDPANCSIAEVIIYNRLLSTTEESRVNSYLKGRYAL